MPDSFSIASLSEIPPGGRKSVIIDETPALLLRIGDDFYCIEDVCTHDGQPLTDGPVADCQITCPRHGARFDLRTGKPTRMPATEPVRTFAVEVRGEDVVVRVK
jgi:3-phenylpropionate/trans-cinnamate dioxygenase ferredoxin subunit